MRCRAAQLKEMRTGSCAAMLNSARQQNRTGWNKAAFDKRADDWLLSAFSEVACVILGLNFQQ